MTHIECQDLFSMKRGPRWPSIAHLSTRCFKSIGLSVLEFNMHFQDGGYLGFLIGKILAIFYLQVATTLPTKVQVSWPCGSGEEVQNGFSRCSISAILDFQSEQF